MTSDTLADLIAANTKTLTPGGYMAGMPPKPTDILHRDSFLEACADAYEAEPCAECGENDWHMALTDNGDECVVCENCDTPAIFFDRQAFIARAKGE